MRQELEKFSGNVYVKFPSGSGVTTMYYKSENDKQIKVIDYDQYDCSNDSLQALYNMEKIKEKKYTKIDYKFSS